MKKFFIIIIIFISLSGCTRPLSKPKIEWVEIPAGTFSMGSPSGEKNRDNDETQHMVTLGAFKISKYEITIEQFKAFIDATGYKTDADKGIKFKGSIIWIGEKSEVKEGINWKYDEYGTQRQATEYKYPVIHVSWRDAKAFAKWMDCRLPTEAEWEYACRAGTITTFNTGDCLRTLEANFNGNQPYNGCSISEYPQKIIPVGSFAPNAWGVYDMHGNLWEWCSDYYNVYTTTAHTNPDGPSTGMHRVFRGGCWHRSAQFCRSTAREFTPPIDRGSLIGFRIVSPI